jgi:hypothetical protein
MNRGFFYYLCNWCGLYNNQSLREPLLTTPPENQVISNKKKIIIEYTLELQGIMDCIYCHHKKNITIEVIHFQEEDVDIINVNDLFSKFMYYECENCEKNDYLIKKGYYQVNGIKVLSKKRMN